MADDLTSAAANGDEKLVESLIQHGVDVNAPSREGFSPLCIAAFWGYSGIVKSLLNHSADVNACNKGTLWTALHCAAFQGHGKVIMTLMEHKPDVTLKDSHGRTAADFASAVDPIWPFFAAAGCKRTPKSELISKNIVKKISQVKETQPTAAGQQVYFSRPGSAYALKSQSLYGERKLSSKLQQELVAVSTGDVLTEPETSAVGQTVRDSPSFTAWRS